MNRELAESQEVSNSLPVQKMTELDGGTQAFNYIDHDDLFTYGAL